MTTATYAAYAERVRGETTLFRRVLVPLDGSALSEAALGYARELVQASGGTLILVRATTAHGLPMQNLSLREKAAVDEAEAYLQAQVRVLREAGFQVEWAVPYGAPVRWIPEEVAIRRADAIVMATHGRGGLGRWVYGSVAEQVLAHSPVPVLLVRSWTDDARLADGLVRQPRLLVPLDGSSFSEAVLPVAAQLAQQLDGELLLMQAAPLPSGPVVNPDGSVIAFVDQQEASFQQYTREYLHAVARQLKEQYPTLRVQFVVASGPAAACIGDASTEQQVALVVMATHGRTGVARSILGSVAGEVLRGGQTPVLLVRPSDLASAPMTPVAVEPVPAR